MSRISNITEVSDFESKLYYNILSGSESLKLHEFAHERI